MSAYRPTAADLLDDEPPAPADWPILPATHYYGYTRPHQAGDLAHIWRRLDRQVHTAVCKAQTKQPPLVTEPRASSVLCARCRAQAPDAPAPRPLAEQPTIEALDQAVRDGEAPLVTVEQLDALPARPALLPVTLQERARRYVAARRRSGEALLDAVAELASARAEAKHGEWTVFLQSVGLSADAAEAQLQIARRAASDPVFAERVRTGFLSLSTARELLSAPEDVQERVLTQPEPPTRQEIREAKQEANPAPARIFGTPPPSLVARAADLGLTLSEHPTGFELSGGYLAGDPALFGTVEDVAAYLAAREKESRRDAAHNPTTPSAYKMAEDALVAAQNAGPTTAERGSLLEKAKGLVWGLPSGSGRMLLRERYDALLAEHQAATAPAQPVAGDGRTSCRTCGKPFTNGHFGGQCGPCWRAGAQITLSAPPAEPAAGDPDAEIRAKAASLGLLVKDEDGGYKFYFPGEEDDLDQFDVFTADYARTWLADEAPYLPRPDGAPAPSRPAPVTVMPAPGETVAAAVAANRDNRAWQAGNGLIDDLAWAIIGALETDGGKDRDPAMALLHTLDLMAALVLELGRPMDPRIPVVHIRLAELEAARTPLGAVLLQDLGDVDRTLLELAGDLDDTHYGILAARLGAVRGRKVAA